jgi:glycosyltransferase involved in cell wall biosynthesis
MYPDAPIYTSFCVKNSDADKEFRGTKIIESRWAFLIKRWRLYSPLRFLLPAIWGSIDLSDYDLVITSTSNYMARGFKTTNPDIMSTMSTPPGPRVVAYCHTPPRFLYGYTTGLNWQKYWPVRIYGEIIGHFLRIFDFNSAAKIDHWIANSKNVQERIRKFYRKEAAVIYPPVNSDEIVKASRVVKKQDFYLIAARLVGSKGLREAVIAAKDNNIKLKIAGAAGGFVDLRRELKELGGDNVELLGRVTDEKLWKLYAGASGFIALARDEDFGMTVVEAQAAGTPVIAFNGGGFRESVVDGKTGILIDDTDARTLGRAFEKFEKIKWDKKVIQKNAKRFSKDRFEKEFRKYIASV